VGHRVLIAGGGIGGLAAAYAAAGAGAQVRLFERASAFGEVGAGIQLGPNVTRVLHGWGLAQGLRALAAYPDRLQVRSVASGAVLGLLRLGKTALQRYGAPYATVHRAELHALLLQAVRQQGGAELQLQREVLAVEQDPLAVRVQTGGEQWHDADLLVAADGLWSTVRRCVLDDGAPRLTGHRAYRALVPLSGLPAAMRSNDVTVWVGSGLHAVVYPVRAGEWLNVVAIVQDAPAPASQSALLAQHWDHASDGRVLRSALGGCATELADLVHAVDRWRMWVLCDRPPMTGPKQHVRGRVALLGDAAHPMRPYLAQGAGMAIEDAAELGRVLCGTSADVCAALQDYANRRWRRNRQVQQRALRNGQIFHAQGLLRLARDAAMRVLGERLIDMPWLYRA